MDSHELFYLFPNDDVATLQEYGLLIGFGGDNMEESLYVRVYVEQCNKYLRVYDDVSSLGFLGYDVDETNMVLIDNMHDKKILHVREIPNDRIQLICEGKIMFTTWVKASVGFSELHDDINDDANEETFYKLRKVE